MANDIPEIVKLGPPHSKVASPGNRANVKPTTSSLPAKCFLGSLQDAGILLLWCPQKLAAVLGELQAPQGGEKRAGCIFRVLPSFLLAHRLAAHIYP